jgi:hypothetical protein
MSNRSKPNELCQRYDSTFEDFKSKFFARNYDSKEQIRIGRFFEKVVYPTLLEREEAEKKFLRIKREQFCTAREKALSYINDLGAWTVISGFVKPLDFCYNEGYFRINVNKEIHEHSERFANINSPINLWCRITKHKYGDLLPKMTCDLTVVMSLVGRLYVNHFVPVRW